MSVFIVWVLMIILCDLFFLSVKASAHLGVKCVIMYRYYSVQFLCDCVESSEYECMCVCVCCRDM